MSKRIVKLIENSNYSEREFLALYSLYKYRCLSFDQIYTLHYNKSKLGTRDVDTGYLRRRMAQFKKDGLIEKMTKIEKDCPPLFTLTTDGIKVVRTYFNLSSEDEENDNGIFATNLTYSEIKIEPKFSFHQFYLNSFAINLNKMFSQVNGYTYVDERHMNKSQNVRPDGLCVIPKQIVEVDGEQTVIPETHFFLENDMGTETIGRIRQKFEAYRAFLESSRVDSDVRIAILFICKDSKLDVKEVTDNSLVRQYQEGPGVKKRIRNIKKAISEAMLDYIKDDIDVFVGTQPRLLAALKVLYLPMYCGMSRRALLPDTSAVLQRFNELEFKDVDKLLKFTNGVSYDYYAKSDVYHKSFIFLEYFGDPMSVIHKIEFHKKNTLAFRQTMHRPLNLVIVANKEDNLVALNEVCELSNPKYDSVMFTTINRLKLYPLEQALFKFTSYGTATFSNKFNTLVPDNTIL